MCGIFGFLKKEESVSGYDKEIMNKMGAKLRYRGPDDQGFYYGKNVALGNNLLSIVDIKNGHQPLIREINGNRYVIVYNGEIFNYDYIKKRVESSGLSPLTHCDTEIALLAYIT